MKKIVNYIIAVVGTMLIAFCPVYVLATNECNQKYEQTTVECIEKKESNIEIYVVILLVFLSIILGIDIAAIKISSKE